jgi:integral membrane protein (TIGR01906 family)
MKKRDIIGILPVLTLPLLILLGNLLWVTFDLGFYTSEFKKLNVYGNFADPGVPDRAAEGIIAYFREYQDMPPSVFSGNESSHLMDVKKLLTTASSWMLLLLALLVFSSIAMFFVFENRLMRNISIMLVGSGMITIGLIILLGISALFFDQVFVLFHHVFFPQGNWTFPADSTLIRVFPERFFYDAFTTIIIRSAAAGVGLIIAGIGANHIMRASTK